MGHCVVQKTFPFDLRHESFQHQSSLHLEKLTYFFFTNYAWIDIVSTVGAARQLYHFHKEKKNNFICFMVKALSQVQHTDRNLQHFYILVPQQPASPLSPVSNNQLPTSSLKAQSYYQKKWTTLWTMKSFLSLKIPSPRQGRDILVFLPSMFYLSLGLIKDLSLPSAASTICSMHKSQINQNQGPSFGLISLTMNHCFNMEQ